MQLSRRTSDFRSRGQASGNTAMRLDVKSRATNRRRLAIRESTCLSEHELIDSSRSDDGKPASEGYWERREMCIICFGGSTWRDKTRVIHARREHRAMIAYPPTSWDYRLLLLIITCFTLAGAREDSRVSVGDSPFIASLTTCRKAFSCTGSAWRENED